MRLAAIAAEVKAKSFTIVGEAVVIGPDGSSRFERLSHGEGARTAILYAFDLIEHGSKAIRMAEGLTGISRRFRERLRL